MKNIQKAFSKIIITVFFMLQLTGISQEFNIGADVVSRYIWRGVDFGNAPSVQPSLTYTLSGFEVGAWGAYQIGRDANGADSDELDLYLGYSIDFESFSLGLLVTDYYFPNSGKKIGNFNNWDNADGAGAHLLEAGVLIGGTDSFPLSFAAYINFYNDKDNTSYFELNYSSSLEEYDFNIFLGATPGGENYYYGTDSFNVINIGLGVQKEIKITEEFSLPVFANYILNPNIEKAFLVFGISI